MHPHHSTTTNGDARPRRDARDLALEDLAESEAALVEYAATLRELLRVALATLATTKATLEARLAVAQHEIRRLREAQRQRARPARATAPPTAA